MRTFLFVLFLLTGMGVNLSAQTKTEVTSIEVDKLLKTNQKFIILDVRTPGEFQQGHLKGAINLDINSHETKPAIEKMDRDAKYLVYCRTKNRSGVITNFMTESGFKNVWQMSDGIVGWYMNNLPLEK
jgi:rhodanese-related sulfurtransferase